MGYGAEWSSMKLKQNLPMIFLVLELDFFSLQLFPRDTVFWSPYISCNKLLKSKSNPPRELCKFGYIYIVKILSEGHSIPSVEQRLVRRCVGLSSFSRPNFNLGPKVGINIWLCINTVVDEAIQLEILTSHGEVLNDREFWPVNKASLWAQKGLHCISMTGANSFGDMIRLAVFD